MIKDPGRLAWTTLIIAFIIFCITVTAVFLVARWFILESAIPMTATLYVGRGTVSVRANTGDAVEQAERSSRWLSRDVRLTTDSTSQGYITFTDSYSQNIVATLVLHHDSSITLFTATQPRFEFSQENYVISVNDADGQIDVDIAPNLTRRLIFDVTAQLGRIRMSGTGRYLLNSQSDEFSVWNRTGEAAIINQELQARSVPVEMQGRIVAASDEIVLDRSLIDILTYSGFDTFNPANQALSSEWGCYSERNDPNSPLGTYAREIVNDTSVMHILRQESAGKPANNHAETGCLQYLNTRSQPLPIGPYNYLELRASMMIRSQSLSTCGNQGSECPVMIRINFVDQYGNERPWFHGFYAYYDPAAGYPLRCDTCALEHERLNPNTWYTFSSGNLLQLFPEDQRPTAILNVHFYASGHQYEVMLAEVALLAGNVPQGTDGSEAPTATPTATPGADDASAVPDATPSVSGD